MAFDFDLFVIGGGSGGVRAARVAAEAGARVALAEEYRMGGTCVIRGCVPKKLFVYASAFADAFEDARGFGWTIEGARFDWERFRAARDAEVARLEAAYRDRLLKAGVTLHDSRAVLVDAHRIRLADGRDVTASHILIATGGRPVLPDVPGAELGITSNEVFELTTQPRSVAIVGGGYIASEFAGILNGLGTRVIQIYRGPQILRGFDDEVRAHVADAMRARGVALELGRDIERIEAAGDEKRVVLTNGESHLVDQVLFATGRAPNTAGLGLEAAGVQLGKKGEVRVGDWSQSSTPSIYAVGDVTDRIALTPVAIREGQAFARTVFAAEATRVDHDLVATAVFTQPEIGTVGLTEAQARERGPVEIARTSFRPMLNVLAHRDERMLMKLVLEAGSQRVLGVHIVGHGAGEMIQLAAVAVGMGATKADFDRTVAVHPTAAEELVTLPAPV
ncbi:glutathione reductase (NADPH) [Amaricoccus macauensis]|uniref:Glutathione reductase n=1 Tax=Amaricoccus macauensis TaxID=57001 RepID=A0A840STP4_9RHOB|nr:glutathione-disulfide reductase [Amaricoccus macauensis]MBB5224130.1 glutathione reductase (NADPH) [Amaricoccus macauensis]